MKSILGSIVDLNIYNLNYHFNMDKYFCIFGGGGIRGAAYTGAVKALFELGVKIEGYAGSSIGAVVAGLLTFGYTEDEIRKVFENINLELFNDINLNFGKDFAISKGGKFYEWMKNKIEEKFYANSENKCPVCFKDVKDELVIFSCDLKTSKFHEFSKAKTPDVEIAHAIRVSVAMPGLYAPVSCENECLVDGDLIKSIPLWMASETIQNKNSKILEFRLENNETVKNISNTFEYLNAVYDTISGFASDNIIKTYKDYEKLDYIKINTKDVSVVDFMTSKEKKHEMEDVGYFAVKNYFENDYKIKKHKFSNLYKLILDSLIVIAKLIENKNLSAAKYEMAMLLCSLIDEKKVMDPEIFSSMSEFKNKLDSSKIEKKGFFVKKMVFNNQKELLKDFKALEESFKNKIKHYA